jgi:hypothetical protein
MSRRSDYCPPGSGVRMSHSPVHQVPSASHSEGLTSPLYTHHHPSDAVHTSDRIHFDTAGVDGCSNRGGCSIPRSTYNFPDIISRAGPSQPQPQSQSHVSSEALASESKDLSSSEVAARFQRYYEQEGVSAFLREKNVEIVVVIEGADPQTSHNVQATHSYKCDDILWDHFFVPCTTLNNQGTTSITPTTTTK